MAESIRSRLPLVSPEQRRAAAGQFERANQVLAAGNLDYAIDLLLSCCQLDPVNPVYRKTLRDAEKSKYGDKGRGQSLSFLTGLPAKIRLKKALLKQDYVKALEHAEQVLARNPWDLGVHLAMATAFENLDLPELALWTLDQARQHDPKNPKINRPMARLFENRGQFTQAMLLWELVRQADPRDQEAQKKHKDLAANATIAKGNYEAAIQGQAATPRLGEAEDEEAEPAAPSSASDSGAAAAPAAERAAATGSSVREDRVTREASLLLAKIQANPANPQGYLHLAALYRRADRFDQARDAVKNGLGPTGNHFELIMELADLEIEPLRRDLGVAVAQLAQQPDDAKLIAIRAKLEKEIHARELDCFRRKADRFPTDTTFRFEMAVRLCQTGQTDEAIKELQALRNDPRHQGKALVYLGYCFKSRGNWRLAQRNFEESLKHLGAGEDELRKEILFQLATGYAEIGDFHQAVEMGCELANLDYGYKDIGKRLDEWTPRLQRT